MHKDMNFPKMKTLSALLLLEVLSVTTTTASADTQLVFKHGAYSRLRIKIQEDLPVENCRHTLANLEVSSGDDVLRC